MPREPLIKSGHVVTVDPDLGDLHVEQARKLMRAARQHLAA
jgi:hypothetical protein